MATEVQARTPELPHRLTLDARQHLTVTGVVEVDSFDEGTVVLGTTRGVLVVQGQGLHLQMLSLDGGEVRVDGTVDCVRYEPDAPAGGFFARLFG